MSDNSGPDASDGSSDGWIPHPDAAPIADRLDLGDVDLLAEATHEVRGAILRRLREPRTVAELADVLDVPVTRLYHHINRLDSQGLIQVVATRQVAAVTERRYQVVARSYGVNPDKMGDLDPRELAAALGGVFDVAKIGLQRLVETTGLNNLDHSDQQVALSLAEKFVSPERHREYVRQLAELVDGFESDREATDDDAVALTVLVAAFPDQR